MSVFQKVNFLVLYLDELCYEDDNNWMVWKTGLGSRPSALKRWYETQASPTTLEAEDFPSEQALHFTYSNNIFNYYHYLIQIPIESVNFHTDSLQDNYHWFCQDIVWRFDQISVNFDYILYFIDIIC